MVTCYVVANSLEEAINIAKADTEKALGKNSAKDFG